MFLKRFRPYLRLLKPVRLQFGFGLLCGIISAAASGAGLPMVTEKILPLVTSPGGPRGVDLLLALSLVPLAFFFRAMGGFLNAYYMSYAGLFVLERLRVNAFSKIQKLPLGFFQKNKVGDLMSRILGDTAQLQGALIRIVNSLVKEPCVLLSALAYLLYLTIRESEAAFALIALISVPICVLPIRIIGTRILKKARLAQSKAGEINHVLNENLGAVREVRAYNLEEIETSRFRAVCQKLFKVSLKVVKYDKALSPLIEIVCSIAIVAALYVAVVRSIELEIMGGILAAIYFCYEPVKKLGAVSNTLKKAEASLDRIEYVLHSEDTVPEPTNATAIPRLQGEICFEKVCFSYNEENALKDVDLTIRAGEVVALVGPSGAGKSTFANLVPRFYDPQSGKVLIDNIDVRTISKKDLRNQIAIVSQDAILFSNSVHNNIAIGNPNASTEAIRNAAVQANANDFIEQLDGGYDYQVGERGGRLSGGQRQRLSIARAFLKDAPIIILDEPTSALDAESEHAIQAALEKLSKNRTVLIIAHRFSTIQHADRILVFEKGKVIASGTHHHLFANNDLYRSLYEKQQNQG